MLDDVKAYHDAVSAANEEFNAERDKINDRRDLGKISYNEAGYQMRDVGIARFKALGSAWAKLEESRNPLIAWIAKNCQDYDWQAMVVLDALPATLSELDQLADGYGWCDDYDVLRTAAIEAGVIVDSLTVQEMRTRINRILTCQNVGPAERTEIMNLVLRIEEMAK